jgi:hypothetical protein
MARNVVEDPRAVKAEPRGGACPGAKTRPAPKTADFRAETPEQKRG